MPQHLPSKHCILFLGLLTNFKGWCVFLLSILSLDICCVPKCFCCAPKPKFIYCVFIWIIGTWSIWCTPCMGGTEDCWDQTVRTNRHSNTRPWVSGRTLKILITWSFVTINSDWIYNGYYENWKDSYDYHTAKGFNYHQGPVSVMSQNTQCGWLLTQKDLK